ncbi:winged helix-turn-helix transcriptional regulator [Sulfurisphaera ohwakuensis]|uniref:Winged helix-turn-helix transcriptional regulator n=1 Tax=Sulfurisphaera ohwakuensis TaxID=69656 RepID=A0A650CKL6_SULOH|nr:winged helix-turn-helix transcriptional regulator [Sulfurisphaera ohwakuensis]
MYTTSVTILDIRPDSSSYRVLIEYKGKDNEKFLSSFTKVSKNSYLGTLQVNSKIISILSKYTIMQGNVVPDSIIWTVIVDGYQELKRLLKEFVDNKIDVKVLKVVKAKSDATITARQEQIIKIALEAGYFDFPRRITLNQLAEKLNISSSTLAEILRRAEKNIIEAYFKERGL